MVSYNNGLFTSRLVSSESIQRKRGRGKKDGKLIIFQGSVLLPGSVADILDSEVRGPYKDRCISTPEGRCCCVREFIHSGREKARRPHNKEHGLNPDWARIGLSTYVIWYLKRIPCFSLKRLLVSSGIKFNKDTKIIFLFWCCKRENCSTLELVFYLDVTKLLLEKQRRWILLFKFEYQLCPAVLIIISFYFCMFL